MSSYILCQTKKAEKPYYIENISTNFGEMYPGSKKVWEESTQW